jgi:hypothetical protein
VEIDLEVIVDETRGDLLAESRTSLLELILTAIGDGQQVAESPRRWSS